MMRIQFRKSVLLRVLLGLFVLIVYAAPSSAVFGVRRRCVRRTAIVVGSSEKSAAAAQSAAAQEQAAAAQQQAATQAAATQAAAAAAQASAASAAAAKQAAAAAAGQNQPKTPQQKLAELESMYKQGLISESDYQAAKTKILNEMMQ